MKILIIFPTEYSESISSFLFHSVMGSIHSCVRREKMEDSFDQVNRLSERLLGIRTRRGDVDAHSPDSIFKN